MKIMKINDFGTFPEMSEKIQNLFKTHRALDLYCTLSDLLAQVAHHLELDVLSTSHLAKVIPSWTTDTIRPTDGTACPSPIPHFLLTSSLALDLWISFCSGLACALFFLLVEWLWLEIAYHIAIRRFSCRTGAFFSNKCSLGTPPNTTAPCPMFAPSKLKS